MTRQIKGEIRRNQEEPGEIRTSLPPGVLSLYIAKEQSKIEYQVLKNNNLQKLRNDIFKNI